MPTPELLGVRPLSGVVEGTVGERGLTRARRLPADAEVVLGRGDGWSVRDDQRRVPRELLRLSPIDRGWLTGNGRATLRLRGPGVVRAEFDPGSTQVLTAGTWDLSWDVDLPLRVRVRILDRLTATDLALGLAPAEDPPTLAVGTLHAGRREALTETQRQRLAVLFRHLLEGRPAPDKYLSTAAATLLIPEAHLRAHANKVRQAVNRDRHRDEPLRTLEELGQYLVRTTRAITCEDLRAALRRPGVRA